MKVGEPENLPVSVGRTLGRIPADIRLVVQRFHDHAVDPRLSPKDTSALVRELGFADISAFCEALGLPDHLAERWSRFGISNEMNAVLRYMVAQRRAVADAVEEFESMTHVGIDDFMRERGLI